MPRPPKVVVFDVNETLSDMAPMARRFAEVGAPGPLAPLWFTAVLRDGFALSAAGAPATFGQVARGVLRDLLAGASLSCDRDQAIEHVMSGFLELPVHGDVAEGVTALSEAGHRLVTLSNGSAHIAEQLLAAAGLRDRFERCLSVDDAGAWKPDRRAYAHASAVTGVAMDEMVLVAVHPWDTDGAARAGMRSAWLDRDGRAYPAHFTPPGIEVRTLGELAGRLAGGP